MMRIFLIILLSLSINCHSQFVATAVGGGAGTAVVPVLDVEQAVADGTRTLFTGAVHVGQGFVVTATYPLQSVSVYVTTLASRSLICRIGTSNNLTTYTEEIIVPVGTVTTEWINFVSIINPVLSIGTTYYIGFYADGAADLYVSESGGYDGGTRYFSGTWNLSTASSGTDLTFRIYLNE